MFDTASVVVVLSGGPWTALLQVFVIIVGSAAPDAVEVRVAEVGAHDVNKDLRL